jgi:hypothetical protein
MPLRENIKSNKKELRKFGIIFSLVLALWGGLFLWRARDYYLYFFIFAAAFLLLAIVMPTLLKPVHKAWIIFSFLISWLISTIILIILFLFIFTPIGVILRLFGKDFLDIKISTSQKSYWNYRKLKDYDKQKYEQQF